MSVKVDITGDNTGLVAALAASKAAVAGAAEAMAASFERVAKAAEMINVAMIAVTAVLAGGKVFSEAIQASIGAATGAAMLGRQLGITATQASILKVAMDENFVSTEAVSGASNKIATTLKKNENAFKELGVSTRDSNGNFRNSFDIMTDVNAKLLTFKEGTDRNVEGMKIYGRSWQEIAPTLRLTEAAMEEAKEKATALHLVVGKEGIAQSLEYRKAMAGVHTVFDAVQKAVGDALVPMLTKLGQWFESVGPKAVEATKGAIVALVAVWQTLTATGFTFIETMIGAFEELIRFAGIVVEVLNRVLHLDFKGAKAAWNEGFQGMEDAFHKHADNIKKKWDDTAQTIADVAEHAAAHDTPTDEKTGAASSGGDGKEKTKMAEFELALEQRKAGWQAEQAAEGSFREFSKQQEVAYWQNILETTKVSATDRLSILKKIAADQLAIQKSAFEAELVSLKGQEAEHKNNMTVRLAIEQEYADKVKAAYGSDSKEFAAAQNQILTTKRDAVAQQRKLDDIQTESTRAHQLSEIGIQESTAKEELALHRITNAEYLDLEQQFEAQKYAIKQKALNDELQLISPDEDPVAFRTKMAQIEAVASSHQATMMGIARQANTQQITLTNSLTAGMTRGFATAFQGITHGTMTMGQAFKSVMSSMLGAVSQFLLQWAAKALIAHLVKMSQTKAEITADAAGAAVGGAKSAAAIPYVGWALAIGAAAAIFSAMASYSAAGGMDVPSGINPMTQLHAKEMVLPAPLAERVRGMTDTGDTNGTDAGGRPVNVSFPGKDLGNHFMMHKSDLLVAIKALTRDGHI